MRVGAFFGGLIFGGLAGAALGVLTAPKSGGELRRELADASDNLYRKGVYELEELTVKVDDLRKKLESLDVTPQQRRVHKLEEKMEQVQEALHDTEETTAHSQEMIDRTMVPPQQAPMSNADARGI